MTYFIKSLNDIPGTIVFIGVLMWCCEYIKQVMIGKTSGRLKLVKKQIREEREEREEKEEKRRQSIIKKQEKKKDFGSDSRSLLNPARVND